MAVTSEKFVATFQLIGSDGKATNYFRDFLARVDGYIQAAGGDATWGNVGGTLANQTDLQTALDARLEAGDNISVLTNDAGYVAYPLLPIVSEAGTFTPSDPDINDVTLLLHMDGTDASTTFTDDSSSALTITAQGNAQIDTAQSKFGGASGLFDGTGDYLSGARECLGVAGAITINFPLTIEMWVRPSATNYSNTFQMLASCTSVTGGTGGFALQLNNGGSGAVLRVIGRDSGGTVVTGTAGTGVLSQDTWYHVALTRSSGGVWKAWLDGSEELSVTESANVVVKSGIDFLIAREGNLSDTANHFSGHIDDVRVTNGTDRYTVSFTVPGAAHPDPGDGDNAYTVADADLNTVQRYTSADMDVTIPTGLTATAGDVVVLRQAGTGTLTLTTTGVTINGTLPTWAQHEEVRLRYVTTDEWDVVP